MEAVVVVAGAHLVQLQTQQAMGVLGAMAQSSLLTRSLLTFLFLLLVMLARALLVQSQLLALPMFPPQAMPVLVQSVQYL
jgi:hypothetical protein